MIRTVIMLLLFFVAVLLAFTPRPLPAWMVDSRVLPYAIEGSDACAALAPNKLKSDFRESMQDIQKMWAEQLKRKQRNPDLRKVEN